MTNIRNDTRDPAKPIVNNSTKVPGPKRSSDAKKPTRLDPAEQCSGAEPGASVSTVAGGAVGWYPGVGYQGWVPRGGYGTGYWPVPKAPTGDYWPGTTCRTHLPDPPAVPTHPTTHPPNHPPNQPPAQTPNVLGRPCHMIKPSCRSGHDGWRRLGLRKPV